MRFFAKGFMDMKKIKLNSDQAMEIALQEAQKGIGFVAPNPPVGAVIVDSEGTFLSKGYHSAYGKEHAEVSALKNCSGSLEGATLYVTLEPCAHQGLNPPCADHLSTLPLRKVCIGVQDPNPKVCGQGIEKLRKSSIQVEIYEGKLKNKLYELIEIFSHNMKYEKPFVALKIASSLDGCISDPHHRWITNEQSRQHVSFIRGHYDAVCVGSQTLIQDNPRLNSRHTQFESKKNYAIILDPRGECSDFLKSSLVTQVRDKSKVIVVTSSDLYQNHSGSVIQIPVNSKGLFDLDPLLKELFKRGIYSLLVEGGAQTFASFFSVTQRFYLFLAPTFIGSQGLSWNQDLLFTPSRLESVQYAVFGEDTLITGRLDP